MMDTRSSELSFDFVEGKYQSNSYTSVNVGFGITYVLPVVVYNTKDEDMNVAVNDISFQWGFETPHQAREALIQFVDVALGLRDERVSKVDAEVDIAPESDDLPSDLVKRIYREDRCKEKCM